MKRLKIFIPFLILTMVWLTGCSSSSTTKATAENATQKSSSQTTAQLKAVVSSTSTVAVDPSFTDRDSDASYDDATATHITLNGTAIQVTGEGATASDGVLTISKEGVYVLSGSLSDGQIVVAAADTDKVQLVLNGVSINGADSAPIYVKSANKVFVTVNQNTVNTLTDGGSYVQTDENNVDGVIFSKADLTINGSGTLNITTSQNHGIVSKDDLVITGGTLNITSANDALNGKNAVKIKDGTININSSAGKGITSKNADDSTKGYVYIAGGNITIANSYEGIEGTAVVIEGGNINVTAQDDGFNAASAKTANDGLTGNGGSMENDTNAYLSIADGTIKVNASGDGLDSNGNMYISGGTIYVDGPTQTMNGALDYNGTADISGGTLVAVGSISMPQALSGSSTQYSIMNNFTSICAAGTTVNLTDASGNTIVSYTPEKAYQSVVVSSPELKNGSTYTLTCGSQNASLTLASVVTSNGQTTGPGQGGHGGGAKPQQ